MQGRVVTVAHTGITVSDLARAIRFFTDILCAEVTAPLTIDDPVLSGITGEQGAQVALAYVDLPGHRLELLQYLSPVSKREIKPRPSDPGHFHLSLYVDGIDALLERLALAGFRAVGPVQLLPFGPVGPGKAIYTCGFDGVTIELMDYEQVR